MKNNNIINLTKEFYQLSRNLLKYANRGCPLVEFLGIITSELHSFTTCPDIEIIALGNMINYYWHSLTNGRKTKFVILDEKDVMGSLRNLCEEEIFSVCNAMLQESADTEYKCFTKNHNFWSNADNGVCEIPLKDSRRTITLSSDKSIALFRYEIDSENTGLVIMRHPDRDFFNPDLIDFYESITPTIGVAIANRRAQHALRERIKELTCLYRISKFMETPRKSREEIIKHIISVIPPSFQYPDFVNVEVEIDGKRYYSTDFEESGDIIETDIYEKNMKRGYLKVFHSAPENIKEQVFFLPEEQDLIETIANQISLVLERERTRSERLKLEKQLQHADRLATIGQLSAGVAHELNEPLGSILGFAQLIKNNNEFDEQTERDFEKIIKGSLQAREIVKKLMLFARQMPPQKIPVNINESVMESISLLEGRFKNSKVKLSTELSGSMPEIVADPSQMSQIFVNLIVNALQAMPEGGELTISSVYDSEFVSIKVKDTGSGIPEENRDKVFLPFFTTKNIDEGTGLGLPVVHGIVKAHEGMIDFKSCKKRGTEFTVKLPIKDKEVKDGK